MAVDLETLEIKIEASASNATKSLDNLASSLKNVKSALSNLNGKEKHVEKVGEKAAEAEQKVSDAAKETKDLNEQQNKAASSGKKFSFSLANITKSAGKVQSGISSIFSGFKNGDAASLFGGVGNFGKAFTSDAAQKLAEAGDEAGAASEAAAASAAGWQGLAAVLGLKVASAGVKVWWTFKKLELGIVAAPFKAMAKHAMDAFAKVTQLFAALKRIATYRLLRTAIKEITEGFSLGLENAYYFSSVTGGILAKSLDSISTEMLYLKNSIGAAVAPLINALAPAVEFVVDKFVALVNVVNQFLSALGMSTTWIKAIKYPTTYKDALDDATGSAKELKRTILGIDEINPLNGDNSGGKGSNKWGASDYSQMFEYQTVDSAIGDFASKIREKIETGDWAGVGTLLGQKLNALINKANSLVDWDNGAGEKITKFLTNITSAFNGFVNEFDGTKAGELVGNAIKTAFNSIGVIFTTTDLTTLAGKITDFIDGAFEKIDGEKIGATIKLVVSSLLRTFTTAITGIDKTKLSEDIAGFFKGLDAATIFKDLITAMSAVGDVIWPPIKEGLKGIASSIFNTLWQDLSDMNPTGVPLWQRAIKTLSGIGQLFSGNIINGFSLIFGDDLFAKISEGLIKTFAKLKETFDENGISGLFAKISTAVFTKLVEIWNGIISKLKQWAGASPLTSWMVPLLDKAMINAGENGGKSFEGGLNKDKTIGTTFGNNVKTNVQNGAKGGAAAQNFRDNYNKTMLMNTQIGNAFGGNIKTNVQNGAKGGAAAQNFRDNYNKTMLMNTQIGNAFGGNIYNNVIKDGTEERGTNAATSFRKSFKEKINSPFGLVGQVFGQNITTNVITDAWGKSRGAAASNTVTSDFNTQIDKTTAGGGTFGSTVHDNIYNNVKPVGTANSIRTNLGTTLDGSTSIGQNLGKKIGGNIATFIAKGLSDKKINVNLTGNSGVKVTSDSFNIKASVAAAGGVFGAGQLIIAQEAGPELVGNIGRKTAVANTTQMVDAMAQGVYQANAEGNMLMRQLIQYAAEIAAKEYSSGGEVTVESITSAMARNNRRLGKTTVGVY